MDKALEGIETKYVYKIKIDLNILEKKIAELIKLTRKSSLKERRGGPFGAFVFDDKFNIIATGLNQVVENSDPTAHAEMQAIRAACKKLGTYDLTGYNIYATGYPCPMCLSAIIWANIKRVYYSATLAQAEQLGFRDDLIRKFIADGCAAPTLLSIKQIPNTEIDKLYNDYKTAAKIY